jgi:hypothetical protein
MLAALAEVVAGGAVAQRVTRDRAARFVACLPTAVQRDRTCFILYVLLFIFIIFYVMYYCRVPHVVSGTEQKE